MDAKQVIAWLIPIIARGAAWILAAKLGLDATQSSNLGLQVGSAAGAAALVVVSIYSSLKGRKKLLNTPPPG